MLIKPMTDEFLHEYANVVRSSFATVAKEFGYTDSPEFTTSITNELLTEKTVKGYYPFGACVDDKIVGFVSITDKGDGVYEMAKLTVLPEFRHLGYGKALLDFCKQKVCGLGGQKIVINLMEDDIRLKNWYLANSFVHKSATMHDHIPFLVGYMEWMKD